jgi:hypothetical protein
MLALALLPHFIGPDPAMAVRNYLISTNTTNPGFNVVYPTSTSGTNASCAICHATTGGGDDLNAYGEAWAVQHNSGLTTRAAFEAIQGTNSDTDPTGATNIAEINASTQPGWTPGLHNTLFDVTQAGQGIVTASNTAPPALTGSLDPATNLPPVANAGAAQAVNVGQTVPLNGNASTDPEGHLLTYSWTLPTRPAGSIATLTNPTTVNPTFTADAAGTYVAQLIVNDGTQNSAPATVTITAAPAANLSPVANAGPNQSVNVGATVTLDGSGSSDPERQPLTYSWTLPTRPTGSTATLTNPTVVHPTFVADVAGTFVARLVVDDGTQNSTNTATVTISAAAGNLPPVANAGSNQAVNVGQLVTLNGSGSTDPELQSLTYNWAFTSRPTGSTATLTNPTAVNPTFSPDVAGNYVVRLVVNDGTQNSTNTATVTIAATAANLPPVANAGPNQPVVVVGQTVTLDGTGSADPEGHALTYSWAFVSRPTGSAAILTNPTAAHPTFVPDLAGPYVVGLVVNDGTLNSTNTANVVITVQAPTPTPVCTMTVNPTSLAFGSVNVGTTKSLTTSIRNTGTANCTVSSLTVSGTGFALGSGAPSLPATVAPGATVNVPVNFAPAAAVAASGSLTIGSAVVSLSGTGATVTVPPPTTGAVDYDVRAFKATEEVELSKKLPVRLRLTVKNVGKVPGNAPATVVGMQNGSEVYRKTMAVFAPVGKTGTFDFPSYTPSAAGKIRWTVTIQDQGPARNTATATTEVKGEDKEETEHSDRKRS